MTLQSGAGGSSYTTKVRAASVAPRTYLFGSAVNKYRYEGSLVLIFRVDPEGESIDVKAVGPGSPFDICSLDPGQVFALSLNNLAAVWAESPRADTRVHCTLVAQTAP